MSWQCAICGKKTTVGNRVSHANNRNKRKFKPNLQKVRVQLPSGQVKRLKVCTRCIRSGYIKKPAVASL